MRRVTEAIETNDYIMSGEEAKIYISRELQNFKSPISSIIRQLIFGGPSGERIDWERVARIIHDYIPELQVDDEDES